MTFGFGAQSGETAGSRFREWTWPVGVAVSTVLFTVIAFPPFGAPEAAYVFAVPALLWFWRAPPFRSVFVTLALVQIAIWLILIVWLRHVTFGGYVFISGVLGLYSTIWFLAARWWLPSLRERRWEARFVGLAGLAGLWVVLEWVRTFFLSGFPWLTLASSQWERSLLLQVAAWTGAYGLSFVLVFFNLGFASYLDRAVRFYRQGSRRVAPEFYIALALVLITGFGAYRASVAHGYEREPLMRAGVIHPGIPQEAKWDPAEAGAIFNVLERRTVVLKELDPDVVIWPEAVTPYPLARDVWTRRWIERIAEETGTPLLVGSMAVDETNGAGEAWHNAVFSVNPGEGVGETFYSKRKLVPFGEYIPLHSIWPWMSRIVPIGGNIVPGTSAAPLMLDVGERDYAAGILICYEDVFPALARRTVQAGADFLVVVSNNAWYGREGMPSQHAAHSVLRAVETRRPVVRSTNEGWTGWIDEFGNVRDVMLDGDGSVFFSGSTVYEMDRDPHWAGRASFYVRYGDWFVAVSGLLVLFALAGRSLRSPKTA